MPTIRERERSRAGFTKSVVLHSSLRRYDELYDEFKET